MMNQKLISQSPKVFRHNSIGLGFFFLIGDNNRGDRCSVMSGDRFSYSYTCKLENVNKSNR